MTNKYLRCDACGWYSSLSDVAETVETTYECPKCGAELSVHDGE